MSDPVSSVADAASIAAQAVDALTPLGRGQAQLVTGPHGAGKSRCGIDAVLGQVRLKGG